ncbi:MAG: hypothetical protein L0Y66_10495 [Myxococcaceae bacterium]|nr:hypothetical protein [Myxococcaceae bacterium]MCI0671576.1 hypothetical protein [Myxococcaceae bacterium]
MLRTLAAVAAAALVACGSQQGAPGEPGTETGDEGASGQLALTRDAGGVRGTFTRGADVVAFSSRQVEAGVFELEVRLSGMTLTALLDADNGVSTLDGFASESGTDTQMLDADRALLGDFYGALNAELPAGAAAGDEARYLRRAVGQWAQHPSSVELPRLVMGEQGRGYTMLCSYAKCGGNFTGGCSSYNWYSYAKHDCQHGGFSATINQQIAQLGNHYSCSGDEYYLSGSTWVCGEPDHWSRPKVVGNCFGRCGGGCGGDTQYTLDATNHDGCVRNGHALASAYCDDQFVSATDDELFAPDCY